MKITVLGNGAVGNVIGGLLAQAGESVTLVCADALHLQAVNTQGLWIEGVLGHVNAHVVAQPQLTERPDICLLNTPLRAITPTLQAYQGLLRDVPIVTLQNNPHAADYAAAALGKQYILSAAVLFGATVWAGHVSYPVAGSLLVGEPFESTGFAESIVALLNGVIPTMYVDNIHGAHWTRLITSLHHGFAAATGLTAAQASEHPTLRALAVSVMKEATDITTAKGIQLQSLPDLPPVNKIISVLHMPSPVSDMIPRMLSKIGREEVAAELIVTELKHEGEAAIAYLNGEVVQLGEEIGITAPYSAAVIKIIQQLAGGMHLLTPEQLLATVEAEVGA